MRGRLEPMDTDREDRHVSEDEDRQEFQRMVAERATFQSELDHVPDWNAREDADLGMTRDEWDEVKGRR